MTTVYCINLLTRPDRWKQIQNEYTKFADNLERIEGIEGNSKKGCYLSHIKAIELGKSLNLPEILVLQDDAIFYDDSKVRWNNAIKEVPDDWDLILGGVHFAKPIKRISKNVIQVGDFSGLHCGLYKLNDKIEQIRKWEKGAFDRSIGKLAEQKLLNIYCIVPFVSIQSPGFSNLQHRHSDYTHHFKDIEQKLINFI
jgi:GR25 family glycosyltransferase involved in LPS biosynthesis